ncbi:MAG TPA: nitronate monooxygenase, partial [Lachnospiraceae bacterium]
KACYHCIVTCNPKTTPYCITDALIKAVEGDVENGLLFCGSNVYRANKIESVEEVMEEFSKWDS